MVKKHNVPLTLEVKEKITTLMDQRKSLAEISKPEKNLRVIKYLLEDTVLLEKYLKGVANEITKERLQISYTMLFKRIFHSVKPNPFRFYDEKFVQILMKVSDDEQAKQYKKFMLENHLQADVKNDIWKLYDMHAGGLRAKFIDFSKIESPSLRTEVKHYFQYKFGYSKKVNISSFCAIKLALNVLIKINPQIHYFADVTEGDVRELLLFLEKKYKKEDGEKLSEYTIAKSINGLNCVVSYLMDDFKNDKIYSPKPHINPFSNFTFHNLRRYTKSTPPIPESIVYELDKYSSELSHIHKLIYDIFMNTGLRLKELYFLEEDCIEESRYENVCQLKFKQHKTLASRKAVGLGEYHRVMITKELADKISEYIEETSQKRKKGNSNLIFLSDAVRCENMVMDSQPFIRAIKSIIIKHNICDEDGELWHFTVKQFGKTLAVRLIEQGATTAELAYWLGHMCSDTADRYYAEVRKMKLAELNTKFFREKFDILLSTEQLESYSEEERKLLYTDFRLEYRRVEFGFCLQKSLGEICHYRNSMYNCVNCKNLCTGHKYLSYWQELLDQQKVIFDKLVDSYIKSQIQNYEAYAEYKQEYKLLMGYQSIVSSIKKGGEINE